MNRLARWMIRLYPAHWRERYGDELDALITDTNADARGVAIIADLARGGIRMRFSTSSFPKLVLRLGIGGLLLGFACSYLVTPQYTSKATLRILPAGLNATAEVLHRAINERVLQFAMRAVDQTDPAATRANMHIDFVAVPGKLGLGRNASAFDIVFLDSNPNKAHQTVQALVDAIRNEAAKQPDVQVDVLDRPSLPVGMTKPNRVNIAAAGGIIGVLVAFLLALFHHPWAARPSGFALNG